MSSLTLFVGIDVSKDTLDVAVRPTAETWQVANETADIGTLVAQLEAMAQPQRRSIHGRAVGC